MTALSSAALRSGPLTFSAARAVRLVGFGALALYAGAHWATIVRPAEQGTLLGMFVVAVAAGVTVDVAAGLSRPVVRRAACGGVVLAAVVLMLLLAGMPLGFVRPGRWDDLVSHLAGAIRDLPALRVPYTGRDPWIRTVLLSGGGLLLVAAAVLALRARARAFGAAVCLGVLYTVPIVEHAPARPWLDGAMFALLLAVCLWGERLRRREVPLAVGLGVVVLAAAMVAAPRLDSGSPWIDYESLAESLQSGSSATFRWNHSYGPLNWPRTGVEVARVRARGGMYFKTADLERFDGRAWQQSRTGAGRQTGDTEIDDRHPGWRQTIHVEIRSLRTQQFLGAGTTTYVRRSSKPVREATPGTFEAAGRPLRRGDSYDATVYVPRPSTAELRGAGIDYPSFVARQLAVDLPPSRVTGDSGDVRISFPAWGSDTAMTASGARGFFNIDPHAALQASPYRRAYGLAVRLRAEASDPYDYVRRVIARVQRGAIYSESPPRPGRRAPLDAFLFRDHAGYCQHFAGATALLLRMGGVPARVAAGFSPGTAGPDGERVLRDLDAHSWVEAYFPGIGWVTFDPTPGDSPASDQITDRPGAASAGNTSGARPAPKKVAPPIPGQARGRDQAPGSARGGGGAGGASDAGGPGAATIVLLVLLLLAAGVAGAGSARRQRELRAADDPELEELRRALARTGRAPAPDVTLARLERLLAGNAGARGYVEALRLARYGASAGAPGRVAGPTPAQRRALRRELGTGLGLPGRVRAWLALPPRPRDVLRALGRRRQPPYTA